MSTTTAAPVVADSALGRHLLTIRGFQFIFGAQGDPYALLLRAESQTPDVLGAQVHARGPLFKSAAGAWVTGQHALAREILDDPRFGPRHAGGDDAQHHMYQDIWDNPKLCHIVPMEDAGLNLPRADYERLTRVCEPVLGTDAVGKHRPDVERIAGGLLAGLPGEFDLMTDFAAPAATRLVAEVLNVPANRRERFAELAGGVGLALDAGLCPPQYKTARALMASLAE